MDYYSRLGVNKNASPEELKKAYKKLAMQHHPDRGGDQKTFQEINEAYDTLKDPAKRQQYDNPQPQQSQRHYTTNDMNDIFNAFFGGRQMRRNKDINITVKIELRDVLTGKDVIGKYKLSNGKEELATIKVPPGVESGMVMRYMGLGDNAVPGVPRGNLLVRLIVKNHPDFERDRLHLRTKCVINVLDLILGTEVTVKKIEGGPLTVRIPPGTNPGTILSIPGYGLPDSRNQRRGNMYLEIKGITPKVTDKDILAKVQHINDEVNNST